jgi:hypothetical protein
MALIVDFNQGWDSKTKTAIEEAIRECIGKPPDGEDWTVSVNCGTGHNFCDIRLTTPNQTRTRVFFEERANLPKAISDWIALYPLR